MIDSSYASLAGIPRNNAVFFSLHPIRWHVISICPITADGAHLTKVLPARLLYYSYSFLLVINPRVNLSPIHFGPKSISWEKA